MVVVMTSVTIKTWLSWLVGNYHQELVDNVGLGILMYPHGLLYQSVPDSDSIKF